MTMRLNTTRQEYAFEDANGYRFTVVATQDPESGWSAEVVITTRGLKTAEDAIRRLERIASEFVRQVQGL